MKEKDIVEIILSRFGEKGEAKGESGGERGKEKRCLEGKRGSLGYKERERKGRK